TSVSAQEQQPDKVKKQQEIEALKVAFITKELELSAEEAQKFWPVFNEYAKEKKALIKENKDDALERDEKVLNLRKKYKDPFTKIIGAERVKKLYNAEGR